MAAQWEARDAFVEWKDAAPEDHVARLLGCRSSELPRCVLTEFIDRSTFCKLEAALAEVEMEDRFKVARHAAAMVTQDEAIDACLQQAMTILWPKHDFTADGTLSVIMQALDIGSGY